MFKLRFYGILIFLLFNIFAFSLFAEETDQKKSGSGERREVEKSDLELRLEILEEELDKLRMKQATKKYESVGGMGDAASGVYHADRALSIGGYGEIYYTDYRSPVQTDVSDVERLVFYFGYRFNDWIILNTELEFEHAGFQKTEVVECVDAVCSDIQKKKVKEGNAEAEMAYIDFEFYKEFRLAAGLSLMPVGLTNYLHEPTLFYSVKRPYTETLIIPSTWREIGLMLHGDLGDGLFYYRAGVFSGLQATEFNGAGWIRAGRMHGSTARTQDLAGVAYLDFKGISGLVLGGSYYQGGAGQNEIAQVGDWNRINLSVFDTGIPELNQYYQDEVYLTRPDDIQVHLAEAHMRYEYGPFRTQMLFARGWMSEEDTRAVNRTTGYNVGMEVEGGYAEVAFNVFTLFNTSEKLYLFTRIEYVNTQKKTARRYPYDKEYILDEVALRSDGLLLQTDELAYGNRSLGYIEDGRDLIEGYGVKGVSNPATDRRIWSVGMAYFPHPNVSLKLDYEHWNSRLMYPYDLERDNPENNKIDRINAAVAFIF